MSASTSTELLSPAAYDAAERAAASQYCIRVNQAFFPEMFATVGYPARVDSADQLWRYIDVMHETRTNYNMDYLLFGLTPREFELFKEVTRIVDKHAQAHYGRRAHATAALLRAIHVLRLIKVATGDARPAVLEVGPGCGYLAMLLVMEGYPYIGTDVAQAFYLYQSHMLSHVANLVELAHQDGDITTIETPKPGTAIHIPWWKWVTLTPDKIKLSAGIMTSNHCLCEMHPSSMGYLAAVSSGILGRHSGGGWFVFDSWGYDLLHGEDTILAKFTEYGFRLCHNEIAVSGMALANHIPGWRVYGSAAPVPVAPAAPTVASVPPALPESQVLRVIYRMPVVKRALLSIVNRFPRLKQRLINIFFPARSPPVVTPQAAAVPGPVTTRVPPFKADNPLSIRLTDDRQAVIATATVKLPEIQAFLKAHFAGNIPAHPDEVFFDLIGTRQ